MAVLFSAIKIVDALPTPRHLPGSAGATAGATIRGKQMADITVAIIGAGIGGVYLAAELGVLGARLRLHDIDDSRLVELRNRGGIEVEGENLGFAAIERATPDLGAAVDHADIIVIVTGGIFQASVARSLAPLLHDG